MALLLAAFFNSKVNLSINYSGKKQPLRQKNVMSALTNLLVINCQKKTYKYKNGFGKKNH